MRDHTDPGIASNVRDDHAELIAALGAQVGSANVRTDLEARQVAGADLFADFTAAVPDIVVQPGTTAETAAIVSLLHRVGERIVPRGAGLSYSGGPVSSHAAVAIDVRRLDPVDVSAATYSVRVGAGCTWARLADVLRPHGLRAAHPSPISGSHSTIGGTIAQGITGGMEGVLGVTVVLADGTTASTGAASRPASEPFFRYHGPDLTGLFIGDCGAFGIKTEIVLRVEPIRATASASFAFDDAGDAMAAMIEAVSRGVASRAFILDPRKNSLVDRVSVPEALRTAHGAAANAATLGEAFREVWRLAAGRRSLDGVAWSLHLFADGATPTAAESCIEAARTICSARGREIPDLVPRALRANPYTISGMLGPDGERWVPIHGVLATSRAVECFRALERHIGAQSVELERLGIQAGWFIASSGPYVTIESMFYWRDALSPVHLEHLPQARQTASAGHAENLATRRRVAELRKEHRDIMDAHDAVHLQIGRYYRFTELMDDGSRALLLRIKHALDPTGMMNPGVLGIGAQGAKNATSTD